MLGPAFALGLLAVVGSQPDATLYVSPSGNDAWSGRLAAANARRTDGPFATPHRARDAVRKLTRAQRLAGPVTVMLRGGTYELAEPFALRPEDSGTEACPVVYRAYPGEAPVLSGGRQLSGWEKGADGLWSLDVSGLAEKPRQLFIGGKRRQRARWPVDGLFRVAGDPPTTSNWAAHIDTATDTEIARRGFQFRPGDIPADWARRPDLEAVVLQFWMEARLRIAAVDAEQQSVAFTGGSWRPLTWSFGYYLDNAVEGLTAPGTWCLEGGTIHYRPLPGEDPSTLATLVPALESLVRFEGDVEAGRYVEHVTLKGLGLHHSAWNLPEGGYAFAQAELGAPVAVDAVGARHCRIEGCELAHLGGWGVWFGRGCQDCTLLRSTVRDVGAGCVKIGEPANAARDNEEACRNQVVDNHLADGSEVYLGSPAVWIGQSSGNLVGHNEISGAFQWGVSVGWNWDYFPLNRARDNVVEFNHIHHIGTGILGTHGAIYALGVSPGTTIRNNHIHHVFSNEYWGAGEGIILDNGCSGILVENNLVHHASAGGWGCNFNCYGNLILNNIFAFGSKYQLTRYGDAPSGEARPNGEVFARNIVVWSEGPLFSEKDWWSFATLWDYNLYYQTGGQPVTFLKYALDEWKAKGLDRNSVVADPLFVDPDRGDYHLKPDSPALKLGFRQIDISAVGPRR